MNADALVLINGAGPAGLSAAIALARRGLRVEIAEITPDRSVFGGELLLSSRGMTRRSSRKALARFSDRADQGRITNEIWGPGPCGVGASVMGGLDEMLTHALRPDQSKDLSNLRNMARRTASPTAIGGASGPSPVRGRSKVTDEIIESLRQDIVTDRLKSGERLPNERELAEYFGVSQPTVREALRALDVMGLIQVRHGSGVYVRGDSAYVAARALQTLVQLEQVSIIEALDVRKLLGRETARIAAGAANDADVEVIEQRLRALSELDARTTIDDMIERLAGFQLAVAAAAHSPLLSALEAFLINLLLQLQANALGKRGAKRWIERSRGFHNDRRKIVDAIREHDGQRAYEAMENYLEHQRRTFMADPQLSAMRLSDPRAMVVAADMVSGARGM